MTQIEAALINDCATKCAFEIYKTLKLFKDANKHYKSLIGTEIENLINRYVRELENVTRN